MVITLIVFSGLLSSMTLAHWCSCFPGSESYIAYMCTFPEQESPLFNPEINGFEFNMYIEQYHAQLTGEFGGGCPVREDIDELDSRNKAGDGPATLEDNRCGVPITMDNFTMEVSGCQKNLGPGWNECDGDEFLYEFGESYPESFRYDEDEHGYECTGDPNSSKKKSRIGVKVLLTEEADAGEYKIKLRGGWDPDLYNPPPFAEGCTGDHCGKRVGDSYKEAEIHITLADVCVPSWDCNEWSECMDNLQSRQCNDLNQCGTAAGKPEEEKTCGSSDTSTADDDKGSSFTILILGVIVLGVVVMAIMILMRPKKSFAGGVQRPPGVEGPESVPPSNEPQQGSNPSPQPPPR